MSTAATADQTHVIESLDNDDCPFCEAGTLEPGSYEGDPAVLCDCCEAPVVRFSA